MILRIAIVAILCVLPFSYTLADQDRAAEPSTAGEVYGQGVRETDLRSPEDERAGFHLPDGFEAQLFVAEPQIAKPLNMAWDTRGRLWITNTIEYPYPVGPDKVPRDSIKVLEDTDGDGRADKITTFADKLNIPMGLIPTADGVICFNIPDIMLLRDIDGDGVADERKKLIGPFDTTRDTHGMINSLRRGPDGWIYACHGFNNQSNVTATDGSSVKMISGNTFRFREDGSSIEPWTTGQVNPFGMAADDWGNLYSADCHSKPITALLRGGCYPSFGRPHDGLGFAPSMMDHLHGSTAICGLLYYQADQFPQAFQRRFYSGNVMTSRINCNAIERNGATVTARELPDFMTSDDPWFRPVDIQLGPDGAMYVADFYNKIIGHYEVPLTHPARDRESGRIWRIFYRGNDSPSGQTSLSDYAKESSATNFLNDAMRQELSSPNLTRRELAIERARQNELSKEQLQATRAMMLSPSQPQLLRLSSLAILWSRQEIRPDDIISILANGTPRLQVDALRAAQQPMHSNASPLTTAISKLFESDEPQVRLAAIEAIGRCGGAGNVRKLLKLASDLKKTDPTLRQAARIATRSLLRDPTALEQLVVQWKFSAEGNNPTRTSVSMDEPLGAELVSILPGLDGSLAAEALLRYVDQNPSVQPELILAAITSATKHLNPTMTEAMLRLARKTNSDNPIGLAQSFETICTGLAAQNIEYPDPVKAFAVELAQTLRTKAEQELASQPSLCDWRDAKGAEWGNESRKCKDGKTIEVISSLKRGEAYVGKLSSSTFECPAELTFWLCGHNGNPAKEERLSNYVQLIDAVGETVLQTVYPPRSDIAVEVTWPLAEHVGRAVRVEVVDGDDGSAYAWLGVGRFSYAGLNPSKSQESLAALNPLLRRRITPEVTDQCEPLLAIASLSPVMRARLISSVAEARQMPLVQVLADHALEVNQASMVTGELLSTAVEFRDTSAAELAKQLCLAATSRQQAALANRLLRSAAGCVSLVQLIDQGKLNIGALRGRDTIIPDSCPADVRERLKALIKQATEMPDPSLKALVDRIASLSLSEASADQGKLLYEKNCAACHQLAGKGTLVGPQLDGVGKRGVERLGEDVLDPNRNVDIAFRMSTLLLENDQVVTGLVREQTDGSLQVVGQDGKATTIAAKTVQQRRDTTRSLMPENFSEVLRDPELAALLKFLIAQPK